MSGIESLCEYHNKPLVAFCIIHNELVCEDCTESSYHRDHNNQILLLKAAAQNIIFKIEERLSEIYKNKNFLLSCCSFKLKKNLRSSIIKFFDYLREQISVLETQKLEEFRQLF